MNSQSNMKTKLISILAFTLIAGAVIGADTPPPPITVAVLDFGSPFRVRLRNELGMVSSLLAANLSGDSRFVLVERADLKKVLGEEALGLSGNISPDTAARIGQLTGTKVLVTGQIFSLSHDDEDQIVIVAKVIGTETGRVFAQTGQGSRKHVLAMTTDLSPKIAQLIIDQSTNLTASAAVLREKRIAEIVEKVQGKQRPAVFVKVDERIAGAGKKSLTTETELGLLLQKAGFTVVDEMSDRKPDVIVAGNAAVAGSGKTGGLFSCHATIELKAQDRMTGKILTMDRQEGIAVDIAKQSAEKAALENAVDGLAERLLPLLAQ